jgi:hypothetical protein
MAVHGLLFHNKDGNLVINNNERAFHYWGKYRITKDSTNNQTFPLFNLPTSVSILCFAVTISGTYPVNTHVITSSGKYYGVLLGNRDDYIVSGERQSGPNTNGFVVDFYVFVEANYIPNMNYGVIIQRPDGIKTFNSSRAMLQTRNTLGSLIYWNNVSPKAYVDPQWDVTITGKVATIAATTNMWYIPESIESGVYEPRYYRGQQGCLYNGSNTTVKSAVFLTGEDFPSIVKNMGVPLLQEYILAIDCATYDQFDNLPNYS